MKTLQQYEEELTANIDTVILLGQLGYNKSDLEELRAGLAPLFIDSAATGLQTVGARYPKTFALYLVLEGIYHYNGGDYWTAPEQTLKLTIHNSKMKAGDLFRETLRRNGLPTFENLGGHKNVAPILAHGGIPNYCLNDYFDLLNRAHRREASIDAPALLDQWATDGFPIQIDRPAQRFLLYGSDVAEEFVERCLALWEDGADPESLDLPRRVLEQFDRWRDKHPVSDDGRRVARLSRPRLVYDPYGEGMTIVLPSARYQADEAPQKFTWSVEADERQREEGTWRRSLKGEVEFNPRAGVNVLTVAPTYTVTALADGIPLPSWKLTGLSEPPLLAFDCVTNELLPDRQKENKVEYWITPGERYLVYPRDRVVKADGARKRVELPNPGGQWESYAFETWDLEPDGKIDLSSPDGESIAFRARNDRPPVRPFLDGAPLLPHTVEETADLYNDRPPLLDLPPGRTAHNPAKWRITITPVGASDPPDRRSFSLAELPQHCVMVDEHVLLSLDAPELLGASPLGEFHIHLRGPYGRRAEFHLRFAPDLRFEGYPQLYLAADDTPTSFLITFPADLELVSDDPDVILGDPVIDGVSVTRRITAAADLVRLPLTLRGERVELGINLPVYRLRLGLVEPERPEVFHWTTTPLRLHPAELDAPHSALLRADLPPLPGAPPLLAGWRLTSLDGRVLRETQSRPSSRYPQTNLAEWLDAFNHEGDAAMLQLVMAGGEHGEEIAVDVVRLLPTLEPGRVITAWQLDDSGSRLSVVWETAAPVRNRQLRLWPVDRPWVTVPVILPVSDEASDFATWTRTAQDLPPGEYLAEMIIHDPWDADPIARPAEGTPNTFLLRPNDMAAALDAAVARAGRDELPVDEALAWVLCMARTGLAGSLARLNITLKREQALLSMEQLTLWADAVHVLDAGQSYRLIRSFLFQGERIARLGGLTDDGRRDYLAHLPDDLEPALYRALLPLADGAARLVCLEALCRAGDETGFRTLLDDVTARTIDADDAIRLLSPAAAVADFLFEEGGQVAIDLLCKLLNHTPDERFVVKGSELWTDAGFVRVTGIKVAATNAHQEVCRMDSNTHYLVGRLWPEAAKPLPVRIGLKSRTIRIMSGPIYSCRFTGQPACCFSFATPAELKRHHKKAHKMLEKTGDPEKIKIIELTRLSYTPPAGYQK